MFTQHLKRHADSLRHWCPHSERFTGGDSLIYALENGWTLTGRVHSQRYSLRSGVRHVTVHTFKLRRGNTVILMNVIDNPYVSRLVYLYQRKYHRVTVAAARAKSTSASISV